MIYGEAMKKHLQSHGYEAMRLRAVLFDMDGVLFNSMPLHAKAWSIVMNEAGYDFPEESVYLNEGRTGSDTINIVHTMQFGEPASPALVDTLCKKKCDIFDTYPEAPQMAGAHELVKKVKQCGLTPMIVTGSGTPTLIARIQGNFPGLFEERHIITGFDVKRGKPHPDPYLLALERGGFKPSEAIVVENAPLGVTAGVAAGIFTIAANTGPLSPDVLKEAGANIVFRSVEEICYEWENIYSAATRFSQ